MIEVCTKKIIRDRRSLRGQISCNLKLMMLHRHRILIDTSELSLDEELGGEGTREMKPGGGGSSAGGWRPGGAAGWPVPPAGSGASGCSGSTGTAATTRTGMVARLRGEVR